MNRRQKKLIANIVLAVVLAAIAAAGVLTVGHIKGWFEAAESGTALAAQVSGAAELERSGLAYPLEAGTALREGDGLSTAQDAELVLKTGGSSLIFNEQTSGTVLSAGAGSFAMELASGEVFVRAENAEAVTLQFAGKTVVLQDTVVSLSVRTGSETLLVYGGAVTLESGETALAGQSLLWTAEASETKAFLAADLDEFCIAQALSVLERRALCFTAQELNLVLSDREAERQAAIEEQAQLDASGSPQEPDEPDAPEIAYPGDQPQQPDTSGEPAGSDTQPEPAGSAGGGTAPSVPEPQPDPQSEPELNPEPEPEPEVVSHTCTVSIRCDTILNHLDSLTPGKEAYVPSGGVILSGATISFTEGETAFDVLKRACSAAGIQLEYSYTPGYGSYYVEGINNLYEFDCGPESGWMYKVNGWFPNYGCSSYTLSPGDSVVFCYTCSGLGADLS